VDRSSTGSVTVTAARDVTLSSITSAAPFSATIRSPIVLAKGATASIPVTFAPTTVGSLSGTLALTTSDGETVKLDVHGLATRDGLAGTPGTLTYTDIPTGSKNQQVVNRSSSPSRLLLSRSRTRPQTPLQ
jgi:hypothetical protein